MKLNELKQGQLFKFNKKTKINWYVAYAPIYKGNDKPAYIEAWASNEAETERTYRPNSPTWNRNIILIEDDE